MAIYKYKTQKGKTRYKAELYHNSKKVASKSFDRKVDAVEWKRREMIKLTDQSVGRLKGENVTLSEFYESIYWPNKGIRDGTATDYRRVYEKVFKPHFGTTKLVKLDETKWSSLFSELTTNGVSKSRLNRIHAMASAIFKIAVQWNYVFSNPLKKIAWQKEGLGRIDYLSFDEIQTFLDFSSKNNHILYPLYHVAYETGLRMSEIIALTKNAVDLNNQRITVRQSFDKLAKQLVPLTKSGHDRILGLNPILCNILRNEMKRSDSDLVFTRSDNESMVSHNVIRHHLRRNLEVATVRNVSFHVIRHTFASHFMMNGGNIYDLKQLMGHSQIETTMRYAHLSRGHLESMAKLVSFDPKLNENVVEISDSKRINGPFTHDSPTALKKA